MSNTKTNSTALVLLSKANGLTLIAEHTPLTRLNYFDGKFLRAADLQAEQSYLRSLVQYSNRADGSGVAYGFNVSLGGGDTLNVGPGLAVDTQGRVLLLPQAESVSIEKLIQQSQATDLRTASSVNAVGVGFEDCVVTSEETPVTSMPGSELYLLVICYQQALCGQEDVFGKLCEEACSTSTDRPYVVEGVALRAVKLPLHTALATSSAVPLTRTHQRSLIASAYYNDERLHISSLINKEGLKSDVWCFGALPAAGDCVPIGVISRAGGSTVFLDAWIARRERIDAQAKRYWQWRMAMRPWDVFLAQILQFQCQLHDLFQHAPEPGGVSDPCGDERQLISDAAEAVGQLSKYYETVSSRLVAMNYAQAAASYPQEIPSIEGGAVTQIGQLHKRLLLSKEAAVLGRTNRILIRGGIVELPSAGYLPVTPGDAVTINKQVRMLLGEGVDLRFCIVRPDYVAHAVEEAQHMERISLLQGLDHPNDKPQVDILVPDGELFDEKKARERNAFEASLSLYSLLATAMGSGKESNSSGSGNDAFSPNNEVAAGIVTRTDRKERPTIFHGASRAERNSTGGGAFHVAAFVKSSITVGATLVGSSTTVEVARASKKDVAGGSAESDEDTTAGGSDFLTALHDLAFSSGAGARAAKTVGEEPQEDQKQDKTLMTNTDISAHSLVGFRPREASGAFWLTMDCEKDLFALEGNQTSSVDLRVIATVALSSRFVTIEAQVRGEFTVEEAAHDVGHRRELNGSLSALASIKVLIAGGPSLPTKPSSFEASATITLTESATSGNKLVRVVLKDPNDEEGKQVAFKASLGGDPFHITAEVDFVTEEETAKFLAGRFLSNPAVFEPVNQSHKAAVAALDLIGSGLDSQSFVQRSTRLLFPPPLPPDEELKVRGTLDWVLFHRRRNKTCKSEVIVPPPPPPVVKSVCHTVYRARAARNFQEAVRMIEQLIQQGSGEIKDAIEKAELVKLGDVQFEEHTAKVFGDGKTMNDVGKAWTDHGGGVVSRVAVVFHSLLQDNPSRHDQAKSIIQKISGAAIAESDLQAVIVPASVNLPTACPSFSILVAEENDLTARILYQTDSNNAGDRFFAATQPAVLTVQFNPDGSLSAPLSASTIADIRRVFANFVRRVELAHGQTPADAQADTRLNAIFAGLAVVLQTGATKQVVVLKPTEQIQLDLGGGASAADVIFLIR